MSPVADSYATWLADYYLLSTALLAVALVGMTILKQPVQRLAIAKSTLIGMVLLAAMCAVPGWSVVHLLTVDRPPPLSDSHQGVSTVSPLPIGLAVPARSMESEQPPAAETARPADNLPPPDRIAHRPLWPNVLTMMHLTGAGAIAAWLLLGLIASLRLRQTAQPASPEIVAILDEVATTLEASRQRPQLLTHNKVDVAVALGVWQPIILLPAQWTQRESRDHLRTVLAHESAHVFNHDLQWAAAARVLFVALWANPLFGIARRQLRLDQETLADAAAAEFTSRQRYAEQLVAWARNVSSRPAMHLSSAVALWEGPSQLRQRIAILLNERFTVLRNCSRGWRFAAAATSIAAAMALSMVTLQPTTRADEKAAPVESAPSIATPGKPSAAPASNFAKGPMPGREPNTVRGRAVDEKGIPIVGAEIFLFRVNTREGTRKPLSQTRTDADGRFQFDNVIDIEKEFPGRKFPGSYEVGDEMLQGVVRAPGHVTRFWLMMTQIVAQLGDYQQLEMLPSASLRGTVTDANGKPVAGALVWIGNGNFERWDGAKSSRTDLDGNYHINDVAPYDAAEFEKRIAEQKRQMNLQSQKAMTTWTSYLTKPILTVEHPDYAVKHTSFEKAPGTKDVQLDPAASLEGRVIFADTGKPAAGALVEAGTSVADRGPPTIASLQDLVKIATRTDADGKYRVSTLPAGKYDVWAETPGWVNLEVDDVVASPGKTTSVRDLKFTKGGVVSARLVDAKTREPIAVQPDMRAMMLIRPVSTRRSLRPLHAPFISANAEGRFELNLIPGKMMMGAGGVEIKGTMKFSGPPTTEVTVVEGQTARVDFPVTEFASARTNENVLNKTSSKSGQPELDGAAASDRPAVTELVGIVVGPEGKPLADVTVDAWTWYRGNETTTDEQGRFRLKGFEPNEEVEIEFRKKEYGPRHFIDQRAGTPDWVVRMDNTTYLEGFITDTKGAAMTRVQIRAERGPYRRPGMSIGEVATIAATDSNGRYQLYLEPDTYRIRVRVPGGGVARYEAESIAAGEKKQFNIRLQEGITFRAKVVDTMTDKPVEGIVLWNWQNKEIEGTSNAEGMLEIRDMFPGKFEFNVSAVGANRLRSDVAGNHARWWSQEAVNVHEHKLIPNGLPPNPDMFQRNFDNLTFDIVKDMPPVTIFAEPLVTITGRVVDPDGKPVAGATVAPAKTGSGNSLTGDTRFSRETKKDGTFEMKLPASGLAQYNLVAHDGKYQKWRKWANGTGPPITTLPGDRVENVELKLTRPATIRGRALNDQGNPIARKEVRAADFQKRDNRYYVPTTKTNGEGNFDELKFVSPGKHYVQVAPFWLDADRAPEGTSTVVEVKEGEAVEGVIIAPQLVVSEIKAKANRGAGGETDAKGSAPVADKSKATENGNDTATKKPSPPISDQGKGAKNQPVDLSIVVAKHVLLLNGNEIITWDDLDRKIAALPEPSNVQPQFYSTNGVLESGAEKVAKSHIWDLSRKFKLKGHGEGTLLPRTGLRYDTIRTKADLIPDESLRVEGAVIGRDKKPIAGAEVVLITPVPDSLPYKAYDITLVEGRVRNRLNEVVTETDSAGQFAIYPPKGQKYYVLALHPADGLNIARGQDLACARKVQLLAWAALTSELGSEPGMQQSASIRTRLSEQDGYPEVSIAQYWSDLKREKPTNVFGFTHVPPIFTTSISRDFAEPDGRSMGLNAASVSLLPGESRSIDLGPLSDKQREWLKSLLDESKKRSESLRQK